MVNRYNRSPHPGDLIKVRVYRHDCLHSLADLVEVLEYDERSRGGEGDRRKHPEQGCKYFGKWYVSSVTEPRIYGNSGGCQLQPMPYEQQLQHKLHTVELAYRRFSGLDKGKVPEARETIGSPKQWGYRTKITPHFHAPPLWAKKGERKGEEEGVNERVWEARIGFDAKGGPGVLDIEVSAICSLANFMPGAAE